MHVIEYFYSAHSAFAYLGHARLCDICLAEGATLVHRPIPLSPVVEAQGSLPFAARTQAHVDYFFGREIERWAEERDRPVVPYRPTHHDADYALASGLIMALGDRGDAVDAMADAVLTAHWRDDADLSDRVTLAKIATAQGQDAEALLALATGPEVAERYAANAAEAIARGVLGSPTYFVNGDPFYGQDRLAMVARALRQPFAPTRWTNPSVG
ncbi:2-hydroxychromene-2-carboxylate isomerase [Jannaschia pohangensis]|uniref:2-hydroxychromene-2-carboxylate isomerase n=1 Tax=Jannaschia pohangensis TaxID=390807 RepID=A0A1I3RY30_9RHOB|nr:2-hydroxychromene-2-carboxylate isomerase [Jannaschia pohangensis]SFJ50166.1 2-hydroxychromene-2-carboxylate isomerase [Jannaschia pohangensis]